MKRYLNLIFLALFFNACSKMTIYEPFTLTPSEEAKFGVKNPPSDKARLYVYGTDWFWGFDAYIYTYEQRMRGYDKGFLLGNSDSDFATYIDITPKSNGEPIFIKSDEKGLPEIVELKAGQSYCVSLEEDGANGAMNWTLVILSMGIVALLARESYDLVRLESKRKLPRSHRKEKIHALW